MSTVPAPTDETKNPSQSTTSRSAVSGLSAEVNSSRKTPVDTSSTNTEGSSIDGSRLGKEKLKSHKKIAAVLEVMSRHLMLILIITSVLMGVVMGVAFRSLIRPHYSREIFFLKFPGRLVMNMFTCVALPVIVTSVLEGATNLWQQIWSPLLVTTFVYSLAANIGAIVIGLFLALTIPLAWQPRGDESLMEAKINETMLDMPFEAFLDMISNCFPNNLITATFSKDLTEVQTENAVIDGKNVSLDTPVLHSMYGMNVPAYLLLALVIGAVMSKTWMDVQQLESLVQASSIIVMDIAQTITWISPIGFLFLVMTSILEIDSSALKEVLSMFITIVILGLVFHGVVVLPFFYWVFTRKNPVLLGLGMAKALFTAWATASSLASLPVTMMCLESQPELDPDIVRFAAPIEATINRDGTALFISAACVVIAQTNHIRLDAKDIVFIAFVTMALSFGIAGTPKAGLTTTAILLTSMGIPSSELSIIVSAEWILDRCRTTLNVWTTAIGTAIVSHRMMVPLSRVSHEVDQMRGSESRQSSGTAI